MDKDAMLIVAKIEKLGGKLPFNDKADAEVIKAEFGLSKAAFKRAVGRLYKQRKIEIKENRGENVNGKKQDPPGQCGQER